jgi:phosphatidylserine/phosphatidylglycerophosphate/cardiolipin synthase-like enzyme
MNYSPSFIHEFFRRLEGTAGIANEFPVYRANDASDRQLLSTCSQPQNFLLGTGASIFTDCLIPAIASARSEVIFVTCFWARSKTLTALHDALVKLAAHRRALMRDAPSRAADGSTTLPPLMVRICVSSMRLLHPQSRNGYIYPPSSWEKKLGLPEPASLEAAGIQLQVKSLFFLPLSVMHPKFVIVDRQRAFLPSCNVSWESWLEGCVEITGDAVRSLLSFYSRTWGDLPDSEQQGVERAVDGDMSVTAAGLADLTLIRSTAHYRMRPLEGRPVLRTLVLPSPHHRNPRFRPFPWQKAPTPPGTPLNTALLQLFEEAEQSIYIQTPNLTCEPVIAALLQALSRGVDVTIVTNRNMMLLEQLVTAGTTTAWCIRSLIRRFHRIKTAAEARTDLEAVRPTTGCLRISYFRAAKSTGVPSDAEEPVHSHLKLTLVDDVYAVLGSGNMDRASWFTSQELGILFQDHEFCMRIKAGVDHVLERRFDLVFDSDERPGP